VSLCDAGFTHTVTYSMGAVGLVLAHKNYIRKKEWGLVRPFS